MYLLDTNVCIAIINGRPRQVGERFESMALAGIEICVSSVSVFELNYGVEKSALRAFNVRQMDTFLGGAIRLLAFEQGDAMRSGRVRVELGRLGTPIGPYDVLIAGQALARGLMLVTHNVSEFGRVAGLKVEDWQR